ncbi:hypothetical protein [Rhizobium phaseoli]|nr:hypothetical protein [Rhizobium phaseoli]MDK4724967.1 hypothetical protein [Rhizobium phaseoli]
MVTVERGGETNGNLGGVTLINRRSYAGRGKRSQQQHGRNEEVDQYTH